MVNRLLTLTLILVTAPVAQADKPLRLITFSVPPLVEITNEGIPKGIAVDVITQVFELAKVDYELVVQPPKRSILTAIQEPNSCVFPINRSQEREASFHWIGPVSISRHALYSRPEQPVAIRTLEDARTYQIGSYLGSGVGEYLESLDYQVHLAPDNELSLRMLAAGRVDLWAADTREAPLIARKLDIKLGPPELIFFTSIRSMGCHWSVDRTQINALSRALQQLFADGKLNTILKLDL